MYDDQLNENLSKLPKKFDKNQIAKWFLEWEFNPHFKVSKGRYAGTHCLWWAIYLSDVNQDLLMVLATQYQHHLQNFDLAACADDGVECVWLAVDYCNDYQPEAFNFLTKHFPKQTICARLTAYPIEFPGQSSLWLAMHAIANYQSLGREVLNFSSSCNLVNLPININHFPDHDAYIGQSLLWLAYKALQARDTTGLNFIKSLADVKNQVDYDIYPNSGTYAGENLLFLALSAAAYHDCFEGIDYLLSINPCLLGVPISASIDKTSILELALRVINTRNLALNTRIKLTTYLTTTALDDLTQGKGINFPLFLETILNQQKFCLNELLAFCKIGLPEENLSDSTKLVVYFSFIQMIKKIADHKKQEILQVLRGNMEPLVERVLQTNKEFSIYLSNAMTSFPDWVGIEVCLN